jgi:hypothetical protein
VVVRAQDGDFILRTPDGGIMRCGADPDELQYTLDFFKKSQSIPLLSDMLKMSDSAYDVIRQKIIRKNPEVKEISTDPDRMIQMILCELISIAREDVRQDPSIPNSVEQQSYLEQLSRSVSLAPIQQIQYISNQEGGAVSRFLASHLGSVYSMESKRFSYDALVSRI